MKIIIDWLKEFVEVNETPQELAEIFTLLGAEVESVKDGVLDLEITPNRPDWLSIFGLAKELGAYLNRKVKTLKPGELTYQPTSKILDLDFSNKHLFPRYSAIIFDNITIKPSLPLIQNRLNQLDINVHNNIIDITNYVMMELGLPLHAFDLDEILGHKMILRESKPKEQIKTLDEKIYILPPGSLVIEDEKRLIDLMGIKGAENSGIKDSTKRILLQATVDDPKRIRMTSKKIGLSTEASYRFERGVDQQSTVFVLNRAKQLILESCNARILEAIDIVNKPIANRIIKLDPKRISSLLGTQIDAEKAASLLSRLGFTIENWQVTIPSWRVHDVFFEEDLIEEVARLHGYDKLTKRVIKKITQSRRFGRDSDPLASGLRNYLTNLGFSEVLNYSMVLNQEAGEGALQLEKPLSPETAYLRTSLMPGILGTIARNAWYDNLKIFEIGNVFTKNNEETHVAIASTNKLPFDLVAQTITPNHPLAKLNKLRRSVYIAEMPYSRFLENLRIETKQLIKLSNHSTAKYRPISQFPPSVRDIAIIVDSQVKPREVIELIKSVDERILIVELFDEFKSPKFGANKKSLAFHLIFDDSKKTMKEKEVSNLMDKVTKVLENKFAAKIR